ncbi:DUF4127 family protein [Paucibacter sp. JuS9]|uniref:DUF4127 family protein n=1 Tax=Paucibacter sp. JuS9 TaxID=3228748 RepID=UPI003756D78A
MNPTLVALPVDGRPAVREQVQMLLEAGGCQGQMPPVADLGLMRQPADRDRLASWLRKQAPQAQGLVISVDMLVYGGLVPSRFIPDALEDLQQRLHLLRELKTAAPKRPLYAFAATMRISNNNVAEEEKPYWAEHGEQIWAWSFHADRHAQLNDAADLERAEAARTQIPSAIQQDYLAARARNFAINKQLLDLVAEGVIDRLVLPQDDTADYGFNIAERRALQAAIERAGLQDQVLVYAGADEVMHTLCAHLVATLRREPALKFWLSCSDPQGVQHLRARYEDRPLLDSLASQLQAVGAELVESIEQADLVLALHSAGQAQGDWAMRLPLPSPLSSERLQQWLRKLPADKPLAIADLAYANGADPLLIEAVAGHIGLANLVGYAGWNTASNSLGSLLAQLVLARSDLGGGANQRMACLRLLEDHLYQACLRQTLRDSIDEAALTPVELEAAASLLFVPASDAWLQAQGLPWRVEQLWLPWQRSFEIGLRLKAHP